MHDYIEPDDACHQTRLPDFIKVQVNTLKDVRFLQKNIIEMDGHGARKAQSCMTIEGNLNIPEDATKFKSCVIND